LEHQVLALLVKVMTVEMEVPETKIPILVVVEEVLALKVVMLRLLNPVMVGQVNHMV
jgi:hypothetical protein